MSPSWGPVVHTGLETAAKARQVMTNADKVVLVIEDIESNMKLLNDMLEARGYGILRARNGMEGWRSACEHHPDLILMDIQLPDFSGLEVTKWLKDDEALKSIPVIAVTAFAMDGDEQKILDGGCDAYIAKPISIPHCLETIERVMAEWNPTPADSELEPLKSVK